TRPAVRFECLARDRWVRDHYRYQIFVSVWGRYTKGDYFNYPAQLSNMFFDQGRMNLFAGDIDEIGGSPIELGRLAQPADQIARSESACLKRFRVLIRE